MTTDQKIDDWVRRKIYGSPIAQNTDCWNYFMAEVEGLKAELRNNGPIPSATVPLAGPASEKV